MAHCCPWCYGDRNDSDMYIVHLGWHFSWCSVVKRNSEKSKEKTVDVLEKQDWQQECPQYHGLTLHEVQLALQKDGLTGYIVCQDGNLDQKLRTAILRPNEIKLVIECGQVKRAWREV